MKKHIFVFLLAGMAYAPCAWAQDASPVAPLAPALEISEEAVVPAVETAPAPRPVQSAPKAVAKSSRSSTRRRTAGKRSASASSAMTGRVAPAAKKALDAQADVSVEAVAAPLPEPASATQSAAQKALEADVQAAASESPVAAEDGFVAQREEVQETVAEEASPRVVFNPKNHRDPTLSPDDFLLLQYREQQRLAALEAERQRKLAEERRKREEAERLRQLELARIKDPTREVRNKIKVGGIIGQEVFIGSKIYTVGKSIYGARIVEVHPEEVVFSYKGHKFVRKVQLN